MNTVNAQYLARNLSRCCTGNSRKLLVQTGADRCRDVFGVFDQDFETTGSGPEFSCTEAAPAGSPLPHWVAPLCTALHRSAPVQRHKPIRMHSNGSNKRWGL
jgi:hypothetical protein